LLMLEELEAKNERLEKKRNKLLIRFTEFPIQLCDIRIFN
jgi:hypothetical protein